jgi:hypothetical protein
MVAPRPLLMIFNIKDDCCFQGDDTLSPLVATTLPVYRLFGKPRYCQWHVNYDPGTHNYERDNREAFYRAVNEFFLAGDDRLDPSEIPCDSEVKSPEALAVELPKANATFQSLATGLMAGLPRDAAAPIEPAARRAWAERRRAALRSLVRFESLPAQGEPVEEASDLTLSPPTAGAESGALSATVRRWKLLLGPHWTAPAVEITPQGKPAATVILLADRGRAGPRDRVAELLRSGNRVLVVDTMCIGEQSPKNGFDRERLALLVQSLGGRVLGIHAGQIAAVVRWANREYDAPVRIETSGPRSSLAAQVAVALDPACAENLTTHESLDTLKDVVRRNWDFGQMPEAFCFGLLELVDVEQLKALAAGG